MRPFEQRNRSQDTYGKHQRVSAPPPVLLSSIRPKNSSTWKEKEQDAGSTKTVERKKHNVPWTTKTGIQTSGSLENNSADEHAWKARALKYISEFDNTNTFLGNTNAPTSWREYKQTISQVDKAFPKLQEKAFIKTADRSAKVGEAGSSRGTNTPEVTATKASSACQNCEVLELQVRSTTNTLFEYKRDLIKLNRQGLKLEELKRENEELRSNEKYLLLRFKGQGNHFIVRGEATSSLVSDIVDEIFGLAFERLEESTNIMPSILTPRGESLGVEGRDLANAEIRAIPYEDDIERPQLSFIEEIDNSEIPFAHNLTEKPYAKSKLSLDDPTSFPYGEEIKKLIYPKEQLRKPKYMRRFEEMDENDMSFAFVDQLDQFYVMLQYLENVNEIAVDLENHSYRSYQGFICLMQLSTRENDFVVDCLRLRKYIKELLPIFVDPKILKVFHGADKDILWLQRDFSIYVVNMFDTGRATRILKYDRFSLSYLLERFVNIKVDKSFQTADWRIRPLSPRMIQYARQDTHYLLDIYDRLRCELLDKNFVHAYNSDERDSYKGNKSLLHFALDRSASICMRSYSKPEIREESVLASIKRHKISLDLEFVLERQSFVDLVTKLHFWRDRIARIRDESIEYVLPDEELLAIAKFAPSNLQMLQETYRWLSSILSKDYEISKHMISLRRSLFHVIGESLEEMGCRNHP